MTPDEKALLINTAQKLNDFIQLFSTMNYPDKFIIRKELVVNGKLTLSNTASLDLSSVQQLKLGGASSTIGFFGATPIVKAGAITSPNNQTGAYVQVDVQSLKTAIDAIRTVLQNYGLTA